jgi:pimeloyl-ACP methyl ester carboxylesterase
MTAELLLLPGVTQDARVWQWMDLPPARAWVYPGHGDRQRAHDGLTLEGVAEEIWSAVSGPVDVVGVAFGGVIAQYLALRRPESVRSMVLACTTAASEDGRRMRSNAEEMRKRGIGPYIEPAIGRWFRGDARQRVPHAVAHVETTMQEFSAEAYADVIVAMSEHNTRRQLSRIDRPVTLVEGTEDGVGRGAVDEMHAELPHSRVLRIPGAHMIHVDNPGDFSAVIRDHLAWVDQGAPL